MKRYLYAAAALLATTAAASAQFSSTYRYPLVLQIGDGVGLTSGTGYVTKVQHFEGDAANQFNPLTSATFASGSDPTGRLVLSRSATSEGALTNSVDFSHAVLAGYSAANNTASVNGATANANRVVGFAAINTTTGLSGTVAAAYPTAQASAYNANNIRSAVAVAGPTSNAWTGGTGTAAQAGVRFIPTNTQLSTTPTNVRSTDIYNNQLFVSSSSGAFLGVSAVGTGLQTGTGNTTTLVINAGAGSSSYEYVALQDNRLPTGGLPPAAAGNNLFFVADDRAATSGGGIQRWAWNGTAFNLDYTITVDTAQGARGLSACFDDRPNGAQNFDIVLYTSRADGLQLLQFRDVGIESTTEASKILLATPEANTVFRGVALVAPVPEPTLLLGAGLLGVALLRRRRR